MRVRAFVLTLSLGMAVTAQAETSPSSAATGQPGDSIRTQLVASNDVVVSSEIAARIARMPLKGGDAFKKGDLLVAFDCGLYRAQLRKAEATADAARKEQKVKERLAKLNSIGALDVEQAVAKARAASADAAYMRTMVSSCQISAPFDGRVSKRTAAPFEYVTSGKPLLEILDTGRLEVKLIVPSNWLQWLKTGDSFDVHVDDLGLDVPAEVARIGASVDPVSQTVTLTGHIKSANAKLLPGMSGWARFPKHQ